ncbi:hypothetical protein [Nocardiopsis gilva]|uniref:hypothetical protein n=1 Tax=Nocardiopsis gilva TaxID=280236 RepID=UPI0012FD644F|nr:hypothetical protein [Nocardiopsis gilva]
MTLIAAAGGSIRGLLDLYSAVLAWQSARNKHIKEGGEPSERPSFSASCDLAPDLLAAVFHVVLGAFAGFVLVLTGQIESSLMALLAGAAAPALLQQMVTVKWRLVQARAFGLDGAVRPAGSHSPPKGARVARQGDGVVGGRRWEEGSRAWLTSRCGGVPGTRSPEPTVSTRSAPANALVTSSAWERGPWPRSWEGTCRPR